MTKPTGNTVSVDDDEPRDAIQMWHGNTRLLETLNRCGVEFLVFGGWAVYRHGGRRGKDLDLMLRPTVENGAKLVAACSELGHTPDGWDASKIAEPFKILRMHTMEFLADIITPPAGVDYASLRERSELIKVNGQVCSVIGKSDLIEMKRIAVSASTEEAQKHRDDLEWLERSS